jgi:3-hydroxyacyl-CoA dehydrogenase/enoyl-CoA hydratase/3-hydroxybutyryl-CoA epimerase
MDTVGIGTVVETLDRLSQAHGDRFAPTAQLRDMAARHVLFYDKALQKAA